jgi:hypothetical protein
MGVTKKVAKKATTKSTTKKVTKKNEDKRVLVCANGTECFWTTDGRVIANLVELRDFLDGVTKEVFSYHANDERNDFATWVESVLQDGELASALREVHEPKKARTLVVQRLKYYSL